MQTLKGIKIIPAPKNGLLRIAEIQGADLRKNFPYIKDCEQAVTTTHVQLLVHGFGAINTANDFKFFSYVHVSGRHLTEEEIAEVLSSDPRAFENDKLRHRILPDVRKLAELSTDAANLFLLGLFQSPNFAPAQPAIVLSKGLKPDQATLKEANIELGFWRIDRDKKQKQRSAALESKRAAAEIADQYMTSGVEAETPHRKGVVRRQQWNPKNSRE